MSFFGLRNHKSTMYLKVKEPYTDLNMYLKNTEQIGRYLNEQDLKFGLNKKN
jgi:hypothetical protein